MREIIIIIVLIGLLNSSCRKLVQDEFPEFENKITVNTLIGAGDTVRLYLAYTDELNENPLETIGNADIIMNNQYNDQINFTHIGNGEYISDYIAQEKDSLSLEVAVADKDIVTSSCVVPKSTEIIDADVAPYGWVDEDGLASPLVNIKIENNPSKAIYGVVYAKIYFEEPSGPNSTWYIVAEDYKPISIFDNVNEYGDFIEKKIGIVRTRKSSAMISMAFQLIFRTVDYNYYTYIKSIGAYEVTRNPDFTNSFIMPSNLYSNIKGGYGIMGSYSESETDTIF